MMNVSDRHPKHLVFSLEMSKKLLEIESCHHKHEIML